jgi:hypothetical protein
MLAGRDAAVRRAVREARIDWEEIRSIAQRELLPDAEDLEKALRSVEYADKGDDPAEDIARWASALGAFTAYVYCGSAVIDPDRFAAAAVKHYEARGNRAISLRGRFSAVAASEALESGSVDRHGVCGHCSYMLAKRLRDDDCRLAARRCGPAPI